MNTLSVCLLVSGNLGLVSLAHVFGKDNAEVYSVFTDKKSDGIIDFCKKNAISCFVGNPRNHAADVFLKTFSKRPTLLLSVNYLFLIEEDLISYPTRYAVNIHGSLLPKYRGRTPHVWAIINNEKESGITAHLITTECDKGGILFQEKMPVAKKDTGGSVLKKYNEVYPRIIDNVISAILNDSVKVTEQDETKATYYPKRTPEDGEIDFKWQKERISNWVRAMAPPEYPGAFFYDGDTKIVISRLEFSDVGFSPGMQDGTVISKNENSYIIKTPNGCVRLFKYMLETN